MPHTTPKRRKDMDAFYEAMPMANQQAWYPQDSTPELEEESMPVPIGSEKKMALVTLAFVLLAAILLGILFYTGIQAFLDTAGQL